MINIQVDSSKVSRYLMDVASKQMPYAMARALTKTAQDIQADILRLLPSRFTLRNQWVTKGVRITAARKTKLEASIFTKDNFMELQEKGGTKKPRSANLAVPTSNARRNKRDIITKANRPRSLGDKAGYFIGEVKGIHGLWKRPPKAQQRAARKKGGWGKPQIMFRFEKSAKVAKRWGFMDTAVQTVNQRLDGNMDAAIREALQ